jgi:hypothetical protein
LAFDDDSGGGLYSLISDFVIPSAGTYYLAVSGFPNTAYNPTILGNGVVGAYGDYRLDLSLVPGPLDHFRVTTSVGTTTAGAPFNVTVTAQDASNNTVTSYGGTITFSSTDPYPAVFSPPTYTFVPGDNGVHTFVGGATLFTTGTWDVTVTDAAITGTTNVTVTPAALDHFLVTASVATTQAGTPFDVTVTAQDLYNNTVTGYGGTITFSTLDPSGGSFSPPTYTFVPGDNGVHTFVGGATLFTTGTWDVTVTDAAITGTTNVAVTPAAAVSFFIDVPPSVSSGVPFSITVYALDPYGNIDTNYVTDPSGVVTFYTTTDSDPGVLLPPDYQFTAADAGVVTFSGVVYITPGAQDINAVDTFSGISGSNTVNVTLGPPAPGGRSNGRTPGGPGSEAVAALLSPPGRVVPPSPVGAVPADHPRALQQALLDQVFALPSKPKDWYALARLEQHPLDKWDPPILGSLPKDELLH